MPHSEISGSKAICRLTEAYRRLSRPSSPLIAKASTVCAYSLDHITPSGLGLRFADTLTQDGSLLQGEYPQVRLTVYVFQVVKEPVTFATAKHSQLTPKALCAHVRNAARSHQKWWSQGGSNSRPPACKAGALPAELWPHLMVGLGGFEPPTSPLSGVRSNHLSYRPGYLPRSAQDSPCRPRADLATHPVNQAMVVGAQVASCQILSDA